MVNVSRLRVLYTRLVKYTLYYQQFEITKYVLLIGVSQEGTSDFIKVKVYGQLEHRSDEVVVVILGRAVRLGALVAARASVSFVIVDFLKKNFTL